MNIFFWILIMAMLVMLWSLLAFAYVPIGKIFKKLFSDVKEEINKKDEEE